MTTPERPWDSGLQIERTKLSWQRTALSTLGFCLVVCRLVAIYSWPVALGVGLAALAVGLMLGVTSTHRYKRGNLALHRHAALPDARAFATFTALILVAAIAALGYLFGSWSR